MSVAFDHDEKAMVDEVNDAHQRERSRRPRRPGTRPRSVIVVPCYNEEARLNLSAFIEFAKRNPEVRFVFVDDGSSDGTLQVLTTLSDLNPEAFGVLALSQNSGKAEAVRRGIVHSLEFRPDHVGFWDADLATPLDAIPAFVDVLDASPEFEVVTGARVQLLGRRIKRSAKRHYLGRVFATVVSLLLGMPIYDTQCGAKLFRATSDLRDIFSREFYSNWIFDVEIIARMIEMHRRQDRIPVEDVIYELPLTQWIDVDGSKVGAKAYFTSLIDLVKIYRRYHLAPAAVEIRRRRYEVARA